ncbi:MAG: IS4 family transposase [Bryobacteraceae bacterium]|nr:IS4 family transposase [Bryobacteraceae bacterium]
MDGSAQASFGMLNFGAVDLGDVRRTRRLVTLVDTMCRHPGGTLPAKLSVPADLRALYALMDREEVTHAKLMDAHTAATRTRMAEESKSQSGTVFLRLHDATELDYTSKTSMADDLGQIGQGTQRGFICHNSLVVRADTKAVVGLSSQILHHRANVPKGETDKQRRERESRESRLWLQGVRQSGPAPAGSRCVDISDSLSDTFEYMAFEASPQRWFVLRSRENRSLVKPCRGQCYVQDAARALPSCGSYPIHVQGSPQRKEREATVHIAFAEVEIKAPLVRMGDYTAKSLKLWVIRVWEKKTPPGEEPLEWILLTNVPVLELADARQCIAWYECRPIVEEYHKGMKTGCGIELMQFTRVHRLEPAIAIVSALATTLLKLRDAARQPDADTRPATEVVHTEYVAVLVGHYHQRLTARPTVLQFYMHVARLGGHQNRKSDGFPGWLTLWRGWMQLEAMVDGARAARRGAKKCSKT